MYNFRNILTVWIRLRALDLPVSIFMTRMLVNLERLAFVRVNSFHYSDDN